MLCAVPLLFWKRKELLALWFSQLTNQTAALSDEAYPVETFVYPLLRNPVVCQVHKTCVAESIVEFASYSFLFFAGAAQKWTEINN